MMNERIKELAIQAKIQMVSEPRLQEFAELIVKECASVAGFNDPNAFVSTRIKEHFGVEE